jgi:hypothetical protein
VRKIPWDTPVWGKAFRDEGIEKWGSYMGKQRFSYRLLSITSKGCQADHHPWMVRQDTFYLGESDEIRLAVLENILR